MNQSSDFKKIATSDQEYLLSTEYTLFDVSRFVWDKRPLRPLSLASFDSIFRFLLASLNLIKTLSQAHLFPD
jgi:hypothetical protein